MIQLELFDLPETAVIKNSSDLYEAFQKNTIAALTVVWACNRAYNAGKILQNIISSKEITIIPAWRKMCKSSDVIDYIENTNDEVYVRIYEGVVIAASKNISDVLPRTLYDAIVPFIK